MNEPFTFVGLIPRVPSTLLCRKSFRDIRSSRHARGELRPFPPLWCVKNTYWHFMQPNRVASPSSHFLSQVWTISLLLSVRRWPPRRIRYRVARCGLADRLVLKPGTISIQDGWGCGRTCESRGAGEEVLLLGACELLLRNTRWYVSIDSQSLILPLILLCSRLWDLQDCFDVVHDQWLGLMGLVTPCFNYLGMLYGISLLGSTKSLN